MIISFMKKRDIFVSTWYVTYHVSRNPQLVLHWGDCVVRILHAAEEDNLPPPFDKKIACLCQSIKINNNKHMYHQSQMWKPTSSGVEWAECLLIIGMSYWVQVFCLILDSSVGLSAGVQFAGDSVPETLGSNPVFSRERQLVSFQFENCLPVPENRNQWQQTCMNCGCSAGKCLYIQPKSYAHLTGKLWTISHRHIKKWRWIIREMCS